MTDAATDSQARKSTVLVGAVLLAFAAWNLYRGREVWVMALGGPGAALLLIGAASARASRAFFSVWMRLAAVLGYINSRILLSLMFYGVIAPHRFLMRAFGRDPLRRRGPAQDSYWVPRSKTRQEREKFERLF